MCFCDERRDYKDVFLGVDALDSQVSFCTFYRFWFCLLIFIEKEGIISDYDLYYSSAIHDFVTRFIF